MSNKQLVIGVGVGIAIAGMIGAVASFRSKETPAAKPEVVQSLASTTEGGSTAASDVAASGTEAAANSGGSTVALPAAASEGAAASASAGGSASDERFAVVLASTPISVNEKVAREECKDVQVTRQKPVKDEDKIAGTAIGAVVGGVLGNQIGGGDGKKIATVAGAVAGGYAGRKIQGRIQENAKETVTEKQCRTVYDSKERSDGYRVKYELDGTVRTVRMKTDPGVGTRIPADDRRLDARS